MNKTFVSIIIFFILLFVFGNAFSASYTHRNMGNLAYVLALGIDVGENSKIKISAQFSKTAIFTPGSGSSSEDSSNLILVSGEADSIYSGLNLINSYIGKELNLAHCSVIIFSKDFAKQGIYTEIVSLLNNEEIRPSTNLLISNCSAYDYINNSVPNLEKMTIKYYETFAITSRFTGYISDITIGQFYNLLSTTTSNPTAILGGLNSTTREEMAKQNSGSGSSSSSGSSGGGSGNSGSGGSTTINSDQSSSSSPDAVINPEDLIAGSSSVSGNRGTENIGIAVFKKDKFCGELTAVEAICHLLLIDDVDSFIVSIDNPIYENTKMELQMFPSKNSKIEVTIKDDTPHIKINLNIDADIMTLEKNKNYQSNENLEKISSSAESYIKEQMDNYLNKVCKKYGVDIDNFYAKALSQFSTISEWENFNWSDKIKDAKFDVNTDINVTSSLLITET